MLIESETKLIALMFSAFRICYLVYTSAMLSGYVTLHSVRYEEEVETMAEKLDNLIIPRGPRKQESRWFILLGAHFNIAINVWCLFKHLTLKLDPSSAFK